jgi:hypothetical protein
METCCQSKAVYLKSHTSLQQFYGFVPVSETFVAPAFLFSVVHKVHCQVLVPDTVLVKFHPPNDQEEKRSPTSTHDEDAALRLTCLKMSSGSRPKHPSPRELLALTKFKHMTKAKALERVHLRSPSLLRSLNKRLKQRH